jgi:photosynthetic reaction center H subunit
MSIAHDESTAHDHGIPDDGSALRAVPDLRGIPVEDASGLSIGKLYGTLAETGTGLLRYLDLELASGNCHVLVPIGHARVREPLTGGAPHIRLRAALLEDLEQVPAVPPDVAHIDDPFERELLAAYGRTFHGERYYAHPSYDHSGVFAGDHPVVPESANGDMPLTQLSYMPGWKVAEGEEDIRGWAVRPTDGAEGITVRDLVIDPAASKVRYLVLGLPDETARLLPVGFASVDRSKNEVTSAPLTGADIEALPPHDGGGVDRDGEERLLAALRSRLGGSRKYLLPDFRA